MMQTNSKNYLFIFIVFFIALEGVFYVTYNNKLNNDYKRNEERIATLNNTLNNTPILANAYSIYDMTLGQKLYGKDDEIPMPLASLTKILSIATVLSNHKQNDEIIISKSALAQDGDFGLFLGEKWKLYDLAKLTLVCSANDGAYAMLEGDPNYLQEMNERADRIGMENSVFLNSTGLDIDSGLAGAYASAEDANIMAVYALKAYPTIFSVTAQPEIIIKSDSGFIHKVENTDTVLSDIPNLIFSKTGYTVLAGGNLTVIFQDKMGHDIAVTVLGSTFTGRFADMEKLVNVLELSYGNDISRN